MIGDLLYKLTARDQSSDFIEICNRHVNSVGGSALEAADFDVPKDKILVLLNATFNSHCSALINTLVVALYTGERIDPVPILIPLKSLRTSSGGTGDDGVLDLAVPAGSSVGGFWTGYAVIPPGGFVRAQATYDNVGALNLATLNFHGLLLPRGNVMV